MTIFKIELSSVQDAAYLTQNKRTLLTADRELIITGIIPEGVYALAEKKEIDSETLEKIRGKENNSSIGFICAYDIKLYDEAGNEWQPNENVVVFVANDDVVRAFEDGEELKAFYIPETAENEETETAIEEMSDAVNEDENFAFVTDHFSTYVIVSVGNISAHEFESAVSGDIQADVPYRLSNRSGTNPYQYIKGTVNQAADPLGLSKTTEVSQASDFYFEQAGSGKYFMYVNDIIGKQYIGFEYYDNTRAKIIIRGSAPNSTDAVTLVVSDRDAGVYAIQCTAVNPNDQEIRTYYINQFSDNNGLQYAGWHQNNNGSKIRFTQFDSETAGNSEFFTVNDEIGLSGREFIIANNRSNGSKWVAMSAETVNHNAAVRGLKAVNIVKTTDENDSSINIFTSIEEIALWQFEYINGSYAIFTQNNGIKQYISIENGNGRDKSVVLSDTPHLFDIYAKNGKITIISAEMPYASIDNYDGKFCAYDTGKVDIGNNNRMLTLGVLAKDSILYYYPPYSTAAEYGRPIDLPSMVSDNRHEGYTAAAPVSRQYRSRTDKDEYVFRFSHWETDDGTEYAVGDIISETDDVLKLYAVWELESSGEIPHKVRYVIPRAERDVQALIGEMPVTVGNITEDVITGELAVGNYSILDLTSHLYKTQRDQAKPNEANNRGAYEFIGWRPDAVDTLKQPGERIDLDDAVLDPDGDKIITFTAVWSNLYTPVNISEHTKRSVNFYVSTSAISADILNEKPNISTDENYFTRSVFSTVMDNASQPSTVNDSDNVYIAITYDKQQLKDNSVGNISEANQAIRMMAESGGYTVDETVFRLLDFPTDDEVIETLKNGDVIKDRITIDGRTIEHDELNSDNYTIRWYVCKLQNDGWHIDGKLTPNVDYVTVTKTFSGDSTALNNIPPNFNITVTNKEDSNNAYKLVLTDKTASMSNFGFIANSGSTLNGSYGYIEKRGRTYTWVVPTLKGSEYGIIENNYNISANGITYGIAAQYSVTNADKFDNIDDVPLMQWFGTINGYSATYPAGEINVDELHTVNIFNTYIETGTFVIQKRDQSDGVPMPDVEFEIYAAESGNLRLLGLSRELSSVEDDGKYSVIYENGDTSYTAKTGYDGNIYLKLPKPVNENERYEYLIKERVPKGYYSDKGTPSFNVEVDHMGNFYIDQNDFVEGNGSISLIQAGAPGESPENATDTGVLITNDPVALISVRIGKEWDGARQNSVLLKLTGDADGRKVVEKYITLNNSNSWNYYYINELPLVNGNRLVEYSLEELKIGEHDEGTPGYNHWYPLYKTPVYRDISGNVLVMEGTSLRDPEDAYKVRSIELSVKNVEIKSDDTMLYINKLGADTGQSITGAVFRLYKQDENEISVLNYNGENINVSVEGRFEDLETPLRLRKNSVYYLEEITSPDGYDVLYDPIKIVVDANQRITVEPLDTIAHLVDPITVDDENTLVNYIGIRDPVHIKTQRLTVSKTVNSPGSSNTDTFDFKIDLSFLNIANGYKVLAYVNNILQKLSVYDNDLSFDFSVGNGGIVIFGNLPVGTEYTLTEKSGTPYIPFISIKDDTGVISSTQANAKTAQNTSVSANAEIADGKDQRADVTNSDPHSLTVNKIVEGGFGDREKEFMFTAEFTYINSDIEYPLTGSFNYTKNGAAHTGVFDNGRFTFSLKDGEYITFYDLPHGVWYTITEEQSDHTVKYKLNDGAERSGNSINTRLLNDSNVTFKNNKNVIVPTGQFKSVKDKTIIGLSLLFGIILFLVKKGIKGTSKKSFFV